MDCLDEAYQTCILGCGPLELSGFNELSERIKALKDVKDPQKFADLYTGIFFDYIATDPLLTFVTPFSKTCAYIKFVLGTNQFIMTNGTYEEMCSRCETKFLNKSTYDNAASLASTIINKGSREAIVTVMNGTVYSERVKALSEVSDTEFALKMIGIMDDAAYLGDTRTCEFLSTSIQKFLTQQNVKSPDFDYPNEYEESKIVFGWCHLDKDFFEKNLKPLNIPKE